MLNIRAHEVLFLKLNWINLHDKPMAYLMFNKSTEEETHFE